MLIVVNVKMVVERSTKGVGSSMEEPMSVFSTPRWRRYVMSGEGEGCVRRRAGSGAERGRRGMAWMWGRLAHIVRGLCVWGGGEGWGQVWRHARACVRTRAC